MAVCLGRYIADCKGGFKRWKANFRCALNSLPDVREVKEESGMKKMEPYKVYRLLKPVSHRSKPFCSLFGICKIVVAVAELLFLLHTSNPDC